jgi:hypothetical protein
MKVHYEGMGIGRILGIPRLVLPWRVRTARDDSCCLCGAFLRAFFRKLFLFVAIKNRTPKGIAVPSQRLKAKY